mgnify:CR=1 FL=1
MTAKTPLKELHEDDRWMVKALKQCGCNAAHPSEIVLCKCDLRANHTGPHFNKTLTVAWNNDHTSRRLPHDSPKEKR